ncbi:MAG: FAD:protein FMN transferase, partial [Chloroflexota bacterium]
VLAGAGDRAAAALLDRVAAWGSRLSWQDPDSDLSSLNADPAVDVVVPPTLAAALHAAAVARRLSGGLVDAGVLEARLHVELGRPAVPAGAWHIAGDRVTRPGGARLDLSGVAKGWLAERALRLPGIGSLPVALVECDGDIAVRSDGSMAFDIEIEDPRDPDPSTLAPIGVIRLPLGQSVRIGVATSGTYRHAWHGRSHIVDPASGEPASAGVVTATVIAPDAIAAEALAKVVVLRGAGAAPYLRAAGATAIALTDRDTQLRFPGVERWMA